MDVRVAGEPATTLDVALEVDPGASDLLKRFLSVELRTCPQQWIQGRCAAGETMLLQRTSLNRADGVRVDLTEHGVSVAGGAHVLLTAILADNVPREVQGSGTQLTLRVHGSWEDAGDGSTGPAGSGASPGQPAGPPSGSLADTGARLGGFACLGVLAVAVGFGLARLRAGAA